MKDSIGVGLLGCGLAAQSIHLPTLATMSPNFHIEKVMDVNGKLAAAVAERCNANATTQTHEIVDDEKIQIVVICSPDKFHADQVIQCCQAGKKVVLCEKPLAVTRAEAARIKQAASNSNTNIVVGAMHLFDPAIRKMTADWHQSGQRVRIVRSSIFLPSNDVFINQATDPVTFSNDSKKPISKQIALSDQLRNGILGLAMHNIPLVRNFCPNIDTLQNAHFLMPFGYALTIVNEQQIATMSALMPGKWPAKWHMNVQSEDTELRISFNPSYVLAGSARIEVEHRGKVCIFEEATGGYQSLWQHILGLCRQNEDLLYSHETILGDLEYALDLADKACPLLKGQQ